MPCSVVVDGLSKRPYAPRRLWNEGATFDVIRRQQNEPFLRRRREASQCGKTGEPPRQHKVKADFIFPATASVRVTALTNIHNHISACTQYPSHKRVSVCLNDLSPAFDSRLKEVEIGSSSIPGIVYMIEERW